MGSWAVEAFPEGAKYFVLEGVPGLSVVTERNEGFDAIVSAVGTFTKVGAQTANWSTDEGRAVIAAALAANDNDIQFIFAQNDEMGIGAAQAVAAAGLVPGTDVKIATIDGTTGALKALAAGELSFVAQYNPFFGDVVFDVVSKTLGGDTVRRTSASRATPSTHPRRPRPRSRPVSASETSERGRAGGRRPRRPPLLASRLAARRVALRPDVLAQRPDQRVRAAAAPSRARSSP